MIVLLDTSDSLEEASRELGGLQVEQLLTPLTQFKRQQPTERFAIDNGAFAGFNPDPFLALVKREESARDLCRFVAVPDVVGSARRTLEVFNHWSRQLKGWPLALVAQDGLENFPIEWWHINAIFIGGTTEWKLGRHAKETIRAAKAMGKWVHAGRVNTPGRYEYFEKLGVDSIDGSGLARFSHMREKIHQRHQRPELFDSTVR